MLRLIAISTIWVFLFASGLVYATGVKDDVAEHRASFNYQMFCQGCHAPDGMGHKSVPTLKNFMANFMLTQQGREYLVQVPGSANAPLSNDDLAEVLNWMLVNFSSDDINHKWKPYEAKEVGEYRKEPLFEAIEYRKKVIENLPLK